MAKQIETYKERLAAGLVMHRPGSRKSKIHQCFDEKGAEAALKLAKRLGIAESSAKRWLADWRFIQESGNRVAKAKRAKAKTKKAA